MPPGNVDGKPDLNIEVYLKGSRDRVTSGPAFLAKLSNAERGEGFPYTMGGDKK